MRSLIWMSGVALSITGGMDINTARLAADLSPLTQSSGLDAAASVWAGELATGGDLRHSSEGRLQSIAQLNGYARIGENVGRGPGPGEVFMAMMASPSHRANILGRWDEYGSGMVVVDGTAYIVILFGEAAPTPPPRAVTPVPPAAGVTLAPVICLVARMTTPCLD